MVMINQNSRPKDVAELFLQFGGDPAAYLQFKPAVETSRGADPWVLISALRSGLATTASSQPEATSLPSRSAPNGVEVPVSPSRIEPILNNQPQLVRPARTFQATPVAQRVHATPAVPMSFAAHAAYVAPTTPAAYVAPAVRAASATLPGAAVPRQLDMLFERLAGAVAAPAGPAPAAAHDLLSQWRQKL